MRKPEIRDQKPEVRGQNAEGSWQNAADQQIRLVYLIEKAYSQAMVIHGELGLAIEGFTAHLNSIIAKRLGENPPEDAATKLVASLHTDDLYLTTACARNSEAAWNRFAELYSHYINTVAHSICSTHQEARELASSVMGHLFFKDSDGQSRIASYQGRAPLQSWISSIMKHQSMNQHQLKFSEALPLDSLRPMPSTEDASEIEVALTNTKFKDAIADSFSTAVESLDDGEKAVLVMYVEDQLTAAEIARRFGVHKAQITRRIQRIERRVGTSFFARLGASYKMNPKTMRECATCALRNAESLFSMVHNSSDRSSA